MSGRRGAVVLLSGGLDSTTCACWALREGYHPVVGLTVDYGQRHRLELDQAAAVAARLGLRHRLIRVDLGDLGGSALTDLDTAVPKDRDPDAIDEGEIPITYVPARNTLMLALALGVAEVEGAEALVIGANALDYSGYPDCRPPFLQAFEELANLATKAGVEGSQTFRVVAPLLELTKAQIVGLGLELNAPLELTLSCYDPAPGPVACGRCDACLLRLKGFREAGQPDPVKYAEGRPTA